jgi:hypothetical protein
MPSLPLPLLALLLLPAAAGAQARWKDIGKTSSGNMVSVDPRSVKRAGTRVDATVRVVFTAPVQRPAGRWAVAHTKAMVDCGSRTLAAKENAYYADLKATRLVERTVNRVPGYSTTLDGSLGRVALTYLCAK